MNIITGNVVIKRIWELLEKILSPSDLANYSIAIDNPNDTDTKRVPLDKLRAVLMSSSLVDYRGDFDASVNLYPSSGGGGGGGLILKSNIWIIAIGGTIDGNAVIQGQMLMAKIDNPGQTSANWFISLAGGGADSDAFHKTVAAEISTLTSKVLLVDTDVILGENSETSPTAFGKIGILFSLLKSSLKTYFDNIYQSALGFTAENAANKDISGGYVGKTLEKINFWNTARTFMSFIVNTATTARTYTFPDKAGTVAMLDDIALLAILFDATVGTSGNYATIYDALAAGKKRLKIISNTTENGAWTINSLVYIEGRIGLVVNMQAYQINGSDAVFRDFTFQFAYSVDLTNLCTGINYFDSMTFDNNSTNGQCGIAINGYFTNIIVYPGNRTYGGIGGSAGMTTGYMNGATFVGEGANSANVLYSANIPVFDIKLTGTWSVSAFAFQECYNVNGVYSAAAFKVAACRCNNFYCENAIINNGNNEFNNFKVKNLLSMSASKFSNGTITTAASTTHTLAGFVYYSNVTFVGAMSSIGTFNNYLNCSFSSTITFASDSNKIAFSRIFGLLTLSSGAEYNDISHNTLTGGLNDSSGSATNIIKDNL